MGQAMAIQVERQENGMWRVIGPEGKIHGADLSNARAWKLRDRLTGEPHSRAESTADWAFGKMADIAAGEYVRSPKTGIFYITRAQIVQLASCPKCGAKMGVPCRRRTDGTSHHARQRAAQARAAALRAEARRD